ncbi:MAG TPA: di-heme-cytochrome C peroxidase, partial [Nitrosomonas sp.]|nr:di-heme-cytochrome C peroxidase [Nitrosomonas sp.]
MRLIKWCVFCFVGLIGIGMIIGMASRLYEFHDDDRDRGALLSGIDKFGARFSRIAYLNQGWSAADSLWFYNTSQGSNLLPFSFFLMLEQADSVNLFRDDRNIDRYGYLPQRATTRNPNGLPVGMVKDEYQGKAYMGFTCAACHTTQINYDHIGIRIDGGPANADMENFMIDLAKALFVTLETEEKRNRFIANVMKQKEYDNANEVIADLEKYALRIRAYTIINFPRDAKRPLTHYGYGRLDAFGRIYNRVLEHIMSAKQMRELLTDVLSPDELADVMMNVEPILNATDRDHLLERIQVYLTDKQIIRLRNKMFNPADAPVSYPFLWDVPYHDFIQWNGRVANGGLGPMARNAGQVIGVFATLDWQEKQGISLS